MSAGYSYCLEQIMDGINNKWKKMLRKKQQQRIKKRTNFAKMTSIRFNVHRKKLES
jgi:hypothetical protein